MTSSFARLAAGTFVAASMAFSTQALAADPIEGNWRTESGEKAAISKCGGSFCIKLTTSQHAGKTIGRLKGGNGKYAGTITDPSDDKKYSGSASVRGSSMKLKGCALKIFCKTQSWKKL